MRHLMMTVIVGLVIFTAGARLCVAAEPAPVAQVRATIAQATPVFANQALSPAEHDRQLRVIAERNFDFAYMSRSALGTHWKTLSAAQRKQFVPLFEEYVLATYLTTLQQNTVQAASNGLRDDVTYDDPETAAVHGEVHLQMVQDPLQVDYMLTKTPAGWRLFDIVVDNVSTLANYRDEFNKIINNDGYDALVKGLQAKHLPTVH